VKRLIFICFALGCCAQAIAQSSDGSRAAMEGRYRKAHPDAKSDPTYIQLENALATDEATIKGLISENRALQAKVRVLQANDKNGSNP
jgi:hypothetical protein